MISSITGKECKVKNIIANSHTTCTGLLTDSRPTSEIFLDEFGLSFSLLLPFDRGFGQAGFTLLANLGWGGVGWVGTDFRGADIGAYKSTI